MGTRGFAGVVIDGGVKMTYNHFDSYIEGLGSQVAAYAEVLAAPGARTQAREQARKLALFDENDEVGPEWAKILTAQGFTFDEDVNIARIGWYNALRSIQGDLGAFLRVGAMVAAHEAWPANSLFCEWGYLVNLDTSTIEVYQGFQREPHTAGRFASSKPDEEGYYPVKLIAEVPFPEAVREMSSLADSLELFEI